MNNVFDVGIIGLGVAGVFCAYTLATKHKGIKVFGIDIGRPQGKRRRQIEGWLGCLPNGDGKLYQTDIAKVAEITGLRKAKSANTFFKNTMNQIGSFKVIKDRSPNIMMEKRIKKFGFNLTLNDHMQIYPKEIHALSKYMADTIEQNKNVTFNFDSEVVHVVKQKNMFVISTDDQEYRCKKLIVAAGRSGWRWTNKLYSNFGIIDNNDIARFGIRVEANANIMKDFNKSNCTLKKDNIEIGPLSWFGTVIPEDHMDVAISAFRSNENRWKTDKVSFNLIGSQIHPNFGFEQTDRIGKLTFVLANDRIIRERVSHILTGKSKISIIPEYDWLKETITQFSEVLPEILNKSYFHVPTIIPMASKINIGNNLETEIDGMFVVGESSGIHGILSAGIMGIIAGEEVCK